jgi:hypothetical protein
MSLTPKSDQVLPVRRLSGDALKAWQEVLEKGFEDLVAKDPGVTLRRRAHAQIAEGEAAEVS